MIDLPFSQTFYQWLLSEETSFDVADLKGIDPDIAKTVTHLQGIVHKKVKLDSDRVLSATERQDQMSQLAMDGCPVEDLGLDFTLPGYPNIDYPLTSPHQVRKKRVTSRETILKQGEQLMSELSSPGSLLEIQYEGEVGTGLGSTLEFYSLISKEMQRADLQLCKGVEAASHCVEYVHSDSGLNLPRARDCKSSHMTKIKNKFQFLTKFMAKVILVLKVFSS